MTTEYQEAVRRSKKLIQSGLADKFQDHTDGTYFLMSIGLGMMRRKPAKLLEWSRNDAKGFDALRLSVAREIEQDVELSLEAKAWLVEYLRGKIVRPKAHAGRSDKHWLHMMIMFAVTAHVSEGMKATRNDASAPNSACDAVADALAELNLEPTTFHGVKRVWINMEKRKGSSVPRT